MKLTSNQEFELDRMAMRLCWKYYTAAQSDNQNDRSSLRLQTILDTLKALDIEYVPHHFDGTVILPSNMYTVGHDLYSKGYRRQANGDKLIRQVTNVLGEI